MQQQQSTDLQQNGSLVTGPGGSGGGGTNPSSPSSYGTGGVSGSGSSAIKRTQISGGRFDFEDGGTYCGGWEEGKAHGHGVCTGPKHQGAYAGAWNYGFEVSGVYIWPSGSSFEGQWQNGRRHGLGVEQRGRLIYRGEWTGGYKGRYGVRQSTTSTAKYEGTWANGLQDGYGSETYADGGSYQGQWQEGKRHGYGVRTSAPFGLASHYRPKNIHASMTSLRSNENADPSDKRNSKLDDVRGGFVLKARSDEPPARRNSLTEKSKKGFLSGLKIRKQRSTGDLEKRGTVASGSIRSTLSNASWISTGSSQSIQTDSNASFTIEEEQLDPSVVETYMGEWKRDKRDGYGISERSDGLKYEGEWHNNKKHGYGVTTFRDGTIEEGKYKNNILITSQKKKHLFLIRSRKFRERIEASVSSAQRASKIALQKADIAISRTATARGKAEYADTAADQARIDCEMAVATAREFAPDFKPSVLERFERVRYRERFRPPLDAEPTLKSTSATNSPNNQMMGNKIEPNRNQFSSSIDSAHQQQSTTYQQQQQNNQQQMSAVGRRASLLTKQQSVDYSNHPNQIPSSIYSPQPQHQDLSRHIEQQDNQNSMYYTQSTHHQQNPSYQFQQQQPPGNYIGGQPVQQQPLPVRRQSQVFSSSGYSNNPGMPSQAHQEMLQQQYLPQQQTQQQQQSQYQNLSSQQVYGMQDQRSHMYSGDYGNNPGIQQQQMPIDQHISQQGPGPATTLRRGSRPVTEKPPPIGSINQSSIDHFDHYKRPPSRDSSVDRYTRAASRMSGSRQPSVDRTTAPINPPLNNPTLSQETPERTARSGSVFRGLTPQKQNSTTTGNGTVPTGTGSSRAGTPSYHTRGTEQVYTVPSQPFEDVLLRQRNLGQDIIPSPSQPKRTESLFVPPKPIPPASGAGGGGGGGGKPKIKSIPINVSLQRKKSLPDFQELPRGTDAMSREEVSALGSARREEVRRQIETNERLKANPLLYLVSPQVKDWFSRQQLVLLVLIVNVVLAIMFFKMLT